MSITFRGCANVSVTKRYQLRFGSGGIAYIRTQARKGVLEKVAIRQVSHPDPVNSPGMFNYKDSLNGLWLETELCTWEEAVVLAEAYWLDVMADQAAAPCVNQVSFVVTG
jgi:hypothetical protein